MKWLQFSHLTAISTNGRKASSGTKRLIPKCINSIRLWPEGSLDMVSITFCVLEWVALFKSAFHMRWLGSKLGISEVLSLTLPLTPTSGQEGSTAPVRSLVPFGTLPLSVFFPNSRINCGILHLTRMTGLY